MYDDFHVRDRWSGKSLHCIFQKLIVAISTRHADAVDLKFLAGGQPVWIALPHPAWGEYERRTGRRITDPMAIATAGHYLKTAIETGLLSGRELYSLTLDETLQHLDEALAEAQAAPARA
jgi:hypothetical protein